MCYCIVHLIIFQSSTDKEKCQHNRLEIFLLYPHVCLCVSADIQITSALYPLFSH